MLSGKKGRSLTKSFARKGNKVFGRYAGINSIKIIQSVQQLNAFEEKMRINGFNPLDSAGFGKNIPVSPAIIRIFVKGNKVIPMIYLGEKWLYERPKRKLIMDCAHEVGHAIFFLKKMELKHQFEMAPEWDRRFAYDEVMADIIGGDTMLQSGFSKKEITDYAWEFVEPYGPAARKLFSTLIGDKMLNSKQRRQIINELIEDKNIITPEQALYIVEESLYRVTNIRRKIKAKKQNH